MFFFSVRKMGIFQRGSPVVSVKKSAIFSSVFFSKIVLEIMFSHGLERKEVFEDDKNVNFFKSRKWVFFKGVNPWFGSKTIRPCCFLWLAAIYSLSNSHTFIPFNVTPMS